MQITALGHSCVLLSLHPPGAATPTRVLVDPWLSDHSTGDAMGRFPRVRLDLAALGPIDAVYLSHAHCDHLDPYTLVELWQALATPPALLLPASLSFLLPVLQEYLDNLDVIVMEPHTPVALRGLELLGFYDVSPQATNEDDVMILVVTSGAERVLIEADARLALELPWFREHISALMRAPGFFLNDTVTTENELDSTVAARSCTSAEERAALQACAVDELLDAVGELYAPVDDPSDLWQGERVLRLVHGQGLAAPHALDPRWQRILFPVRIADRVDEERAAAARSGCRHRVGSLTVGHVHTIEGGQITQHAPAPWLTLLDGEAARAFDADTPFFPPLPCAPLRVDARDTGAQRARIQALLDARFLPYLHGQQDPPVLHLLAAYGGEYRIRIWYGEQAVDYVLSYRTRGFVAAPASQAPAQEAYWANDLEDMLDGRCDEFSTFCRQQLPAEAMRLWASLATPLLNSDLVRKRVALHFARARQGLSPGSWVMPLYEAPSPI